MITSNRENYKKAKQKPKCSYNTPFSQEETNLLNNLIGEKDPEKLDIDLFALNFPGRSKREIRGKINTLVDEKSSNWTHEEEQTLLLKKEQIGPKWPTIAKLMKKKPNQVKNRYNYLISKQSQPDSTDFQYNMMDSIVPTLESNMNTFQTESSFHNDNIRVETTMPFCVQLHDDNQTSAYGKKFPLSQFEHYVCIDYIGSGAFSIVFLVQDIKSGAKFSAKIIPMQDGNNEDIENEIMNHQSLKHNNIINIHESFKNVLGNDGKRYCVLILDYCKNGDLSNFLKQNRPSRSLRISILSGIIDGLYYMHFNNMAHGDIKTKNILLSDDLTPKICDLAFSKRNIDSSSLLIINKGTQNYAAPEILQQIPSNPLKTDIYALGRLIQEVMEIKPSYYGDTYIDSSFLNNQEDKFIIISQSSTSPNPDQRSDIFYIHQYIHKP